MKTQRTAVHGVILLDKPQGLTSNEALQKAKRMLNAEKAGHTGSLDPMATGLLPLCFGEASKFAQFGLDANKAYEAVMKLGIATTTADATGEVIEQHPVPEITCDKLGHIQFRFQGAQTQIPPMYSALKQNGVPLYRMARRGETVERDARSIVIHNLELQQLSHDHIQFKVACSKGTYVRTLAEDIGKALGCAAHLVSLRRTNVGALQGPMHTLEKLSESALLPVDALLTNLPKVFVDDENCRALLQGKKVFHAQESFNPETVVRLYNQEEKFFGVATVDAACYLQPARLVNSDYLLK